MVQIAKITVFVVATILSACSMQPMIDATVPSPSDNRAEPRVPEINGSKTGSEIKPQPDQRAVMVTEAAPLPVAAQSLKVKAKHMQEAGNIAGAILQLERALKIAPRSALLYFELAQAYRAQGNQAKARVFAQKALSLGPPASLAADIKSFLASLR